MSQAEAGQTVTCSGAGTDVDGQSTTLTYIWKDQVEAQWEEEMYSLFQVSQLGIPSIANESPIC